MASELIITANGSTPVTGASFGYFAAGLPLEFNFISAGEFVAQWRTFFGGYEVHFSGQATIDPNGDPYLLDGFSLTLTGATLYTVQPDGSLTAIATATMPVFTYAADFAAGDGYQPIVDQFSNITGYRLFVNPQPLKDYIESLDRVVFVGSEINDTYDASYHHSATLMNGGGGDDFLVGARDRRNELFGGEGNDQLLGQGTNDYLDGGAGNDIVNDYEISLNGVVTHDADTLIGGAGADQLTSFGGDDRLFGGEGDDYLLSAATAGSVTHVGDAGNDVIDGGADTDTSVYSGNRADYNVTFMANGRYSITDLRSGSPDGTDTVLNVEYFQFADQTVPVSGIINQAPIAAFTSNANPAAPGQAIAFDASASYDPDGLNHIVSYSWNFGDGSALLVSASTTASHAYALFGTYTVTLTVTEDSVPALTGVATISEIVSQGNHAPVANAGGPYTFQAGSVLTLNGTGSFDPDMSAGDSIISYNWDLNNDGTFDVTSVSPTTVATFAHLQSLGLTGGSYIVTLSVTDSFGVNATASTTLFVNNPPTVTESLKNDTGALSTDKITSDPTLTGTADAGATVTLSEGNITLGTTTADNNGVWTFTPTSLAEGPHTIVASETDAFGNTGTASLTTAPVAFYAFDEASGNIAYDQEGTHDGTVNGASYVPGITSDALSFAPGSYGVSVPDSSDWNFGSGDFSITVWANFGSVPSGSAGELGDVLVAHDEGGGFTNKWVFDAYSEHLGFHVNNHEGNLFFAEAPFNPTPGQWYFLALSKWGSEYQFYVNGQLVGTDIETAPLSDASAELTIGYVNDGSRPSNEYALDNVGIYHNALSQADLAQIYQAGIGGTTINVSGAFTLDTTPPAVTESLANDTGASASDHITSDPTLTGSGDPNAVVHFMVDGIAIAQTATADGSGAWTFAPTGLADGSHTILASETDAAGNTGTASLTFTLDEAPTITSFGGADHVTISRPENNAAVTTVTAADPDAGQTLSYSIVGGVDQNLFTIDETTGALAFVTAPNFEALADADGDNVYDVIVQVSDGNGGTDTQAIAVTVTNENEAPRLVDDAPTGGTSGYQVNPANGHLYKYVSGNFTFEEAEALAATSGAYLATITSQQEQDFIYQNLTLRADGGTNFGWLGGSDREVEGTWRWIGGPEKGVQFWQGVEASSGGQGFGYTNFGITEPNESGPEDYLAFGTGAFPQSATPYQWVDYHNFGVPAGFYLEIGGLAARSVAENTTAVTTVAASDPDAGDTLSYSIVGGADAALFTIDANTGALTFLTAPDFEAPADAGGDNVYDVTVQVSDGNGGTDTQAIAVTVTDVDEIGPTLLSIVATDNTPTNASVVHYTVTFSEVVTGVDASQFALNSSGVSGASIAGVTEVTGSGGTQYTVTVNTGSGDGTVELDLIGTDISDLAGNVLPGGSFQVAQSFSDITGHVTAADLNGDGYQDLVSESSPTTISVMLANGDGTFQPAVNYNAGHDLNGVSVADLNNDGRIDFAISNGGANGAVAVLLGNGDGTFQPAISSPTNSSYATNSAIADLNDDGNLDLTVANNANRGGVSVLLGNGDGTFSPSTVLASDGDPVTVAVADLNGDDIPDIAFSNVAYGAFDVQIYLGDGSGGFVEAPEIQAATHTLSVALDDLDRDGQNDLVFTSYDGTVSVALGNGDGTFGPVASYTVGLPSLGVGPGNVTIEDVNGDGAHDLLVASPLTNSLAVLLGNGDGTFQAAQQFATGGDGSGWVAVADFNGDGRPDAGVANFGSNSVSTLLNIAGLGPTYTIDKNDPPAIISDGGGDTTAVLVPENSTSVTTVAATDPDAGDTLTYSISDGFDGNLFQIDSRTGALSFINAPDFENPNLNDGGLDQFYDVQVRASDQFGGFDDQLITVTVTNVAGVTITGTNASNTINATTTVAGQSLPTNEEDTIYGLGSVDTISALGGNDFIDGGARADTMIGGTGNDTYVVENTGDVVTESPNEGIDTVQASVTYTLPANVENLILMGTGNINGTGNGLGNVITGNNGNNTLAGLAGADYLGGGAGTDTASYAASPSGVAVSLAAGTASGGDAQGDTLVNIENLTGSGFDDTLEGNSGNNVLSGRAGTDTVSYEHAAAAVTVSLAVTAAQNTGGAGTDTLSSFENLTGSALNDVLTGSSGANVLIGLAGDDTLSGGIGADTLIGGTGNDTMTGGAGADTLSGGAGNDTFYLANGDFASGESIDGGADTDAIVLTNATIVNFTNGTVSNIETLTGSSGNDTVTMSATQLAGLGTIDLGGGINVLNVVAGGDISFGTTPTVSNVTTGNLTGTGGNDTITLTGAQLDAIINGSGAINLGAGTDTINLTSTSADLNTLGATNASVRGVEAFSAATALSGVTIALSGQTEGFTITGSANNDTLTGGAGADTLNGGGGNDTLTGGAGADTFVFYAGEANGDTVVDFSGNGAAAGDALVFIGYGAGATFTNVDATHWQVDYNGGTSHEIITFANAAPVHSSDYRFE